MIGPLSAARRVAGASAWLACWALSSSSTPPATGGGAESTRAAALEWSVSTDGRHLAVSASRGRKDQYDAWVVSIADGAVRELQAVERAAPALEFDARGRLRIYTVDTERGTPELVWTDPSSGAVLESTRDRARIRSELENLSFGWAELESRGGAVRRVQWPAQRTHFELDPKRDVELAVGVEPGVVYYSRRVGDQLRLVRRDLEDQRETTLVVEGRGLSAWRLSEDGRAVALAERGIDSRVRVIDSTTGALIGGPWLGDSVEWAPGGAARCLVIGGGGRRRLVDILLDSEREAGDWEQFQVLADGSIVAQLERDLVLLEADLSEVRVLFHGAQLAPLAAHSK